MRWRRISQNRTGGFAGRVRDLPLGRLGWALMQEEAFRWAQDS